MRPIARREIEATKLALALSSKTTDELQQILLRRDPARTNRYAWDAATRRAAERVLRVRQITASAPVLGQTGEGK